MRIFGMVLATVALIVSSCKNDEPSVLKVFVRSASTDLQTNATVVIIADVQVNSSSQEYVDTLLTNESGFAYYNLQKYFDLAGEENEIAYFDIVAKKETRQGEDRVRCRVHTTAVETVFLEE